MTDDSELQRERATNERYRRIADDQNEQYLIIRDSQASWAWSTRSPRENIGPLAARVWLSAPDRDLGDQFYIGPSFIDRDGLLVVSFATSAAALFYGRIGSWGDFPAPLARRTLVPRGNDIRDYVDEDLLGKSVATPPSTKPVPGEVDRNDVIAPREPRVVRQVVRPKIKPADQKPITLPDEPSIVELSAINPADDSGMRAARVVLEALTAPRTGTLPSLLSTLQPEQYELVVRGPGSSFIIQGHPGTGKTVVAAHRAAYLMHPDRQDGPTVSNVLMIGPTDTFSEYVSPVVTELGANGVGVLGRAKFLGSIIGVDLRGMIPRPHPIGSSWEFGRAIDLAAAAWRRAGRAAELRPFIEALTSKTKFHQDNFGSKPTMSEFLLAGRSYVLAMADPAYLPLFAASAVALGISQGPKDVGHVIVDEAQELTWLEWKIVSTIAAPDAGFTILGDINQKHSDEIGFSWDRLAVNLEISDDDGRAPVVEMRRGYRTTHAILTFANGLLPRGERVAEALRPGIKPMVTRVRSADLLAPEAVNEAIKLVDALGGHIAIITANETTRARIRAVLRQRDWIARDGVYREKGVGGRTSPIRLTLPDEVRGLEFDGVVVVEPAQFVGLFGQTGLLYVSLTRATKLLTVLYNAALPKGLSSK